MNISNFIEVNFHYKKQYKKHFKKYDDFKFSDNDTLFLFKIL